MHRKAPSRSKEQTFPLNKEVSREVWLPRTLDQLSRHFLTQSKIREPFADTELTDNEEYWPNSFKFNPERWTTPETTRRLEKAYVPFSKGSRMCIGIKYVLWAHSSNSAANEEQSGLLWIICCSGELIQASACLVVKFISWEQERLICIFLGVLTIWKGMS